MKITPKYITSLADRLATHNRWRRGKGEFAWTGDPATERPMPFTAEQVGKDIDKAVRILKCLAEKGGIAEFRK